MNPFRCTFLSSFLFLIALTSSKSTYSEDKNFKSCVDGPKIPIIVAAGPIKTKNGTEFNHVLNHKTLGDAWCDPTSLCWSAIQRRPEIVDEKRSTRRSIISQLQHSEAENLCKDKKARLPSRDDFERLRKYMGYNELTKKGYEPQILMYLSKNWFWSSSGSIDYPNYNGGYWAFSGCEGTLEFVSSMNHFPVLCVSY